MRPLGNPPSGPPNTRLRDPAIIKQLLPSIAPGHFRITMCRRDDHTVHWAPYTYSLLVTSQVPFHITSIEANDKTFRFATTIDPGPPYRIRIDNIEPIWAKADLHNTRIWFEEP